MISTRNFQISACSLESLIAKTDELSALAKTYNLEEFALLQPAWPNENGRNGLHFFISRENNAFNLEEIAAIKRSLCDILGMNWFSDYIILKNKDFFTEDYFITEYKERCSLKNPVASQEIKQFIQQQLGFNDMCDS
jgi:hypothetical protein